MGFNLCHSVGSRCDSSFLGMCLSRVEVYCCFNSILARLVHEQGRPQVNRGWGWAEGPDCRGFAPGEFETLDFLSMDLREYMQYIQQKTQIPPDQADGILQRASEHYHQ